MSTRMCPRTVHAQDSLDISRQVLKAKGWKVMGNGNPKPVKTS